MPKPFIQVALVDHCVILAQIIGELVDGTEVPSFFAAFMITKEGRPGCSLAETSDLQRISKNHSSWDSLIGFCRGYSAAIQEGKRSVMPHQWRFKGTIDPKDVEEPSREKRDALRNWAKQMA